MAGLCASVFSACKKSDYMPDNAAAATQNVQSARTTADGNGSLMFKSGSLTTTALTVQFNGQTLMDAGGLRTWDMFGSLVKAGLDLRPGTYDNLVTTFKMMPNNDHPFIHLNGMLTLSLTSGEENMARMVDFTMTTPLELRANSGLITFSQTTTMIDLLNLQLGKLGDNIPLDVWKRALDQSGYTIYVSEQSNTELYLLMLRNLEMMLQPYSTTINPHPVLNQEDPSTFPLVPRAINISAL
jgi:hypothetical protein